MRVGDCTRAVKQEASSSSTFLWTHQLEALAKTSLLLTFPSPLALKENG